MFLAQPALCLVLCTPGVAQGSAAPVPPSTRWVPSARTGASWLPPALARALLCGLPVSVLLSAATRKQGGCCFSNTLSRSCALDLFSCGHPWFYFRWSQTLSAHDITSLLHTLHNYCGLQHPGYLFTTSTTSHSTLLPP